MTPERLEEIRADARLADVGCGPWMPRWVTEALDAYESERDRADLHAKVNREREEAYRANQARAERAEGLLRKLERVTGDGDGESTPVPFCPVCQRGGWGDIHHDSDCELAAIIGAKVGA